MRPPTVELLSPSCICCSKCRFYFSVYTFFRTPTFAEDVPGELGEGETVPPPERSFWAKYVSFPLVEFFFGHCKFLYGSS